MSEKTVKEPLYLTGTFEAFRARLRAELEAWALECENNGIAVVSFD